MTNYDSDGEHIHPALDVLANARDSIAWLMADVSKTSQIWIGIAAASLRAVTSGGLVESGFWVFVGLNMD